MNTNTPAEQVVTLEALAKSLQGQITGRQNTISSLDAEIANLRQAIVSETYTISERVKERKDLELQVTYLQAKKETLTEAVDEATTKRDALQAEQTKLEDAFTEQTKEMDERTGEIAVAAEQLDSLTLTLKREREELIKAQSSLLAEKEAHEAKVAKLAEALK